MRNPLSLRTLSLLVPALLCACGPSGSAPPPVAHPAGQGTSTLTAQNGFVMNGFVMNGFVMNGFVMNGLAANGFMNNGLSSQGLLQVPFTKDNLVENTYLMDAIQADPTAGKLLQYMYSCAMPVGSQVGLDLDGNPATGDENGYDLLLDGALGLTPEWGRTGGSCDDRCQRWISACVLARTNAFGAVVDLSVRGPNLSSTPGWPLTVDPTSEEAFQYTRREGSYFGNLFSTAVDDAGTVVWAPTLTACAGPNSDIPYLSLRFCSSLTDDDCPIQVVGNCTEETAFAPSVCDSTLGPSGEALNCYADPHTKLDGGVPYQEVITVYLKDDLTAVCGNHICEVEGAETDRSCPADCQSDSWATRVDMQTGLSTLAFRGPLGLPTFEDWANFGLLTVGPDDAAILGGYSTQDVDLGGGTLPVGQGDRGYLARFSPEGQHLWSVRLGADVNAVATDSKGDLGVAATLQTGVGSGRVYDAPGSGSFFTVPTTTGANEVVFAKLTSDGRRVFALTFGGPGTGAFFAAGDDRGSRALAADPEGNWLLAGSFYGSGSFGKPLTSAGLADVFLTKVSPAGVALWARRFGGTGLDRPTGVSADSKGNVLLTTREDDGNVGVIYALGPDGSTLWAKPLAATFHKAIFDGKGDALVAGSFTGLVDFDGKTLDGGEGSFFLASYDAGGSLNWVQGLPGNVAVQDLALDVYGNVVVFGTYTEPGIDFGAGLFASADADTFVVSYAPDGSFVWAKALNGFGNNTGVSGNGKDRIYDDAPLFTGFALDGQGHVVGTGVMDGFLLFDNRMLVNWVAPLTYDADTFLGAFTPPCSVDGCDTVPPVFVPDSIPGTLVVQANRPSDEKGPPGANAWFNVPLATDQDNAGHYGTATVNCKPATGTRFPIGDTKVLCTATDPHGNTAKTSFLVRVRNTVGPSITDLPPKGPYLSREPGGMVVQYKNPTAVDQVDLQTTLSCKPGNTELFPVGVTNVDCTATDEAGNKGFARFPIWVALDTGKPPATPTKVTAVPGIRQATVTWSGSWDATSYRLEANQRQAFLTVDGDVRTATFTGLENGGTYTFTVTGLNAYGSSTTSAQSNTITLPDVPGAVSNVTAKAASREVDLTWDPAKEDGGSPLLGYQVDCYLGGKELARTVYTADPKASVTGLLDQSSYTCWVSAVNAVGTGPRVQGPTVSTPVVPPAPTQVSAVPQIRSAKVSWKGATGAKSYTVTAHPSGATATVDGTQAVVNGLWNGGTFTFTVVTNGVDGFSLPSAESAPVTLPDVPGAPTGLTGTAGQRQVSLSWQAPTDNGGTPIKWYRVDCTGGGSTKSVYPTGTSVVVTGLSNGTAYTCSVKAVTDVGGSVPVSVGPLTTEATPDAPTNVTAVPGLKQATVSWTASAGATGYTVTSNPGKLTATVAGGQTSATVTGLWNGGTFTFTVVASNDVGDSLPATSAAVTLPDVPGAPTGVSATPGLRSVEVAWTPPVDDGGHPVESYRVDARQGGTIVKTAWATGSPATLTGLAESTTYAITVRALNDVGASVAASAGDVTTLTPGYAPPTNVTAQPQVRQALVSWTGSPGATSYTVTSKPGGLTATVDGGQSSATVTGLWNGGTFTFTVVAGGPSGPSVASAPSAPVTLPTGPGAPTNLSATAGLRQVAVSWDPPADDGGSPILRYVVTVYDGSGNPVVNQWPTSTSATVTGLGDGTNYTVGVRAVTAVGRGPSALSPTVTTTAVVLPSPTGVSATPGVREATVGWDPVPGATSITVTSKPGGLTATVDGAQTSATVTGLWNAGTFTFTVVAANAAGSSPPSAPSSAITLPQVAGAPTNLVATAAAQEVSLSWDAPADDGGSPITQYLVNCYTGETLVGTQSPTGTSVVFTGLADATGYHCSVQTVNAVGTGTGAWSGTVRTP